MKTNNFCFIVIAICLLTLLSGCAKDSRRSGPLAFNTLAPRNRTYKEMSSLSNLENIIYGSNSSGNIYVGSFRDATTNVLTDTSYFYQCVGFLTDNIQTRYYSFIMNPLATGRITYNSTTKNYAIRDFGTSSFQSIYSATPSYILSENNSTIAEGYITVPSQITMDTVQGTESFNYSRSSMIAKWNTDASDTVGVIVAVYAYDSLNHIVNSVFDLIDDSKGQYDFGNLFKECPNQKAFLIQIHRGNYKVLTATNGHKYNLIVYSRCSEYVKFSN